MNRKGLSVLENLINKGYSDMIDKVIIAHDKNVLNDYYDDIYKVAKSADLHIYDKTDNEPIESEYCLTIAWRWMLNVPKGCLLIVTHDSILPKYRGFAPLVNMLINHEPLIGVSAIFASDEYDQGPIIAQSGCPVTYPIKIQDAIELENPLFGEIVCDVFQKLRDTGKLESTVQNEDDASYSMWRDEEDYHIDWNQSAEYIQQFIYSVGYPYKGAYTECDREMYRILDCEIYKNVRIENRTPGKLLFMINGCPVIACGSGLLKITRITNEAGVSILPLKKFRIRLK
jgi:methionyl-tRNA formyltransferase